jgi:hypothetical protein
MAELHRDFWKKHSGVVWSNPEADDGVRIRIALHRPRFDRLLDIALEFGPERLRGEWEVLLEENSTDTQRARPSVERILRNIEKGFASVASRN